MRRAFHLTPLRLVLALTLVLTAAYLPLTGVPLIALLESKLLDLRFRLRSAAPLSEEIVLVLIDDASIRSIGRWPWDRAVLAGLVQAAERAGARTIGMDLLFLEPEVAPGAEAAQGAGPGDRALAAAIAGEPGAVLPFSFNFEEPRTAIASQALPDFLEDASIRVVRGTADTFAPQAQGVLAPIPVLGRTAAGLGHSNIGIGPAGEARFEYPVIEYRDVHFPSFALEVARRALDVARAEVRVEVGSGVFLGRLMIPTDERGRMVVDHRPVGRFRQVSAHRLLQGEPSSAALEDRVVLIGAFAAGLGSTFPSPFEPALPGVARHALVVDSILNQNFLVRRAGNDLAMLGGVVFGGLVLGAVAGRSMPLVIVSFALLLCALVAVDLHAFLNHRLWLPLVLPLASLSLLFGAIVAYRQAVEARQRRALRAAFRHYLSPALVEQVAADPSLLRLGGEERELTVLFADIRNSTNLASRLPPGRFVELLNDAFGVMSRIVFEHHGMLDKFTGDGMIAVFGAPLEGPDHALLACRAAIAVQSALEPVRERWQRPGLPPLEVGIGINTGRMIIGNMGSSDRFDYTVIGEEATLGARIEAANKDFKTGILISEATWRQVGHVVAAREVDEIRFRGMERPVRIHQVLGLLPLAEDDGARLEAYQAALAAGRSGRWREAEAAFRELLEARPDDEVVRLHLARCTEKLAAAAPGDRPDQPAVAGQRLPGRDSAG